MGIPQVEVGLDEGLVNLEGKVTCHNYLLNPSVYPQGELVGEDQLCNYNKTVHPYQDSAAKAGTDQANRDGEKGRILVVDALFHQQLVKRVHEC